MKKLCVVLADYYKDVSKMLLDAAISEQVKNKTDCVIKKVYHVPGAFEIPVIISKNINKYDGFVALGCVIRGETYHFNLIANECARKIIDISNNSLKPIGFGVLTCENINQAIERSDITKKNKGKEAANACIKLL